MGAVFTKRVSDMKYFQSGYRAVSALSCALLFGLMLSLLPRAALSAQTITVTDLLNREVMIQQPVQRMLLSEGRLLYLMGVLDRENPIARIVGWRDDMKKADPATWQQYMTRFPEMDAIPVFGRVADGSFNIESVIALQPDVAIFNIADFSALKESGHLKTFAQLDIPVLFVDFRHQPMIHTNPTIKLLGRILAQETRAQAFIDFRNEQIERVTRVIEQVNPPAPRVFIERIGGFSEECCLTFGDENFGEFVALAGGQNIAQPYVAGTFGQLNPETVIEQNPEHVVVTSADWQAYVPGGRWIAVGPGADPVKARQKLNWYTQRPAYMGSDALNNRQFHAIWHQFYNSPYQFYAIQQLARWFHPELFRELDPEQTFARFYQTFLPVPYQPGFGISLTDQSSMNKPSEKTGQSDLARRAELNKQAELNGQVGQESGNE